jgi:hypothetical protein
VKFPQYPFERHHHFAGIPALIVFLAIGVFAHLAIVRAQSAGSFAVPRPVPEPVLARPAVPEKLHLAEGEANSLRSIFTPQHIEVWRTGSTSPQRLLRHGKRFEPAYLAGSDTAVIRLQFRPQAAGNPLIVKSGPGVTVDPLGPESSIGANGQYNLSVRLSGDFAGSDIVFYALGIKTRLALRRASPAVVQAAEATGRLGR